ncbi:MAG: hypothetical protein ACREEW_13140, partial [Caulobacteraceae bacterium]
GAIGDMSTTTPISSVQPDMTPAPSQPHGPQASGEARPAPSPLDDQPDLRLVIEDDKAAGSYVYVTIDSATGKVVSQIPREQLLRMREATDYKPGSVINATG